MILPSGLEINAGRGPGVELTLVDRPDWSQNRSFYLSSDQWNDLVEYVIERGVKPQ